MMAVVDTEDAVRLLSELRLSGNPPTLPSGQPEPPFPRPSRRVIPGPIHKLPVELFGAILRLTLEVMEAKPRLRRRTRSALRRVSKSWKAVLEQWENVAVISNATEAIAIRVLAIEQGLMKEQYRRLVLHSHWVRAVFPDVLRFFPNLVELNLHSSESLFALKAEDATNVRHLQVGTFDPFHDIDDGLLTPPSHLVLTSIEVNVLSEDSLEDLAHILFASHATLRSLTIHRHALEAENPFFGAYLSRFVSLESLQLGPFIVNDSRAKPTWEAIANLPSLRTLIVPARTIAAFGTLDIRWSYLSRLVVTLSLEDMEGKGKMEEMIDEMVFYGVRFRYSAHEKRGSWFKYLEDEPEEDREKGGVLLFRVTLKEPPYNGAGDIYIGRLPLVTNEKGE